MKPLWIFLIQGLLALGTAYGAATNSPALGRPIALGYVHRYYLTTGTVLEIFRGEIRLCQAVVTTLPFTTAASA